MAAYASLNDDAVDFWSRCEDAFGAAVMTGEAASLREDLWLTTRIYKLTDIDIPNASVSMRMRLYMVWQLTEAEIALLLKQLPEGSRRALSSIVELPSDDAFAELHVPRLAMPKAIEQEELGEPVRYLLSHTRRLVMFTQMYHIKWQVSGNLRAFPVDEHVVQLSYWLNFASDSRRWRVVAATCEFERDLARLAEGTWSITVPTLDAPTTRAADVSFGLRRNPLSHLIKTAMVLGAVAALALFYRAFAPQDEEARRQGNDTGRLGWVLDILLAVLVYLFVAQDGLPKVPYLTLLDFYVYGQLVLVLLCLVVSGTQGVEMPLAVQEDDVGAGATVGLLLSLCFTGVNCLWWGLVGVLIVRRSLRGACIGPNSRGWCTYELERGFLEGDAAMKA